MTNHTFEDRGIIYSGYLENGYFALGHDSNSISCIPRSITGKIYVPSSCVIDGQIYPVQKLSQWCFTSTKITHAILPYSITIVSHGSFEYCPLLEYVDMSNIQCDTLSPYLFSKNYVLVEVKLPEKLIKIESLMFHRCDLLRDLLIPSTVTSIHRNTKKH